MAAERRQRSNGAASQAAILDAAAEIAGERGYEGTSIKLVSERSGLPASSIYWHFKDKDELIEAVIDRSFTAWVDALTTVADVPDEADPSAFFVASMREAGAQLAKFPDFLRLGLMLILEHRPEEPAARRRFRQARTETLGRLEDLYGVFFDGLPAREVKRLTALTLAGSDGLFIAADLGDLDLADEFELLGQAILGAARGMGWTGVLPTLR